MHRVSARVHPSVWPLSLIFIGRYKSQKNSKDSSGCLGVAVELLHLFKIDCVLTVEESDVVLGRLFVLQVEQVRIFYGFLQFFLVRAKHVVFDRSVPPILWLVFDLVNT